MGSLIKTKGTKRLAAHFSEEFDTWISWWRALQAANPGKLFASPPPVSLLSVTDDPLARDTRPLHSRRTDNKCLLPDIQGHPVHVNLEARWRWFLDPANGSSGGLRQANQNKIADGIIEALVRDLTYDCIVFDAVEAGLQQDVAVSEHREDGRKILSIVLITPPMPPGVPVAPGGPPPLDT